MDVDETDPRRAASALLLASSSLSSSSSASLAMIVLGRLFLALFRAGRYADAALSSKELVTRVSSTSLASSDRLQYTCDMSAMKSLLYVAGFILIESDLLYIIVVASVCFSALLLIALLSLLCSSFDGIL